jgi:FkbM family methyltransferase
MILRTRTKLALARVVQSAIVAGLQMARREHLTECRRGGLNWKLDLREAIDFSIFLLGSFEPQVVAMYRRTIPKGSTIIDIGANIGAHTLPLALCVGKRGRVVSVEPTKYAFERLREQVSANPDLPHVTLVQAMLMASSEATLAHEIPASWPLKTPEGAHAQHAGVGKSTSGAKVMTLDALVAELDLPSVDFIKLDVDGFEVEVLRGGRQVLAKFRPTIFFEYAPYLLAEKGYDSAEMMDLLGQRGYRIADLNGRAFGAGGTGVPEVPVGASVNLIATAPKDSVSPSLDSSF